MLDAALKVPFSKLAGAGRRRPCPFTCAI